MQLRIADDIVQTVGRLHQLARVIARQDPDLSKQLRRALNSVGLNAGEGLSARGGNRTVRLESAMASGREAIMALRIAGQRATSTQSAWRVKSMRSIASSQPYTSSPTALAEIAEAANPLAASLSLPSPPRTTARSRRSAPYR